MPVTSLKRSARKSGSRPALVKPRDTLPETVRLPLSAVGRLTLLPVVNGP